MFSLGVEAYSIYTPKPPGGAYDGANRHRKQCQPPRRLLHSLRLPNERQYWRGRRGLWGLQDDDFVVIEDLVATADSASDATIAVWSLVGLQ